MKHTGTPAYRLTADCIWNSFQSSGKRHLVLTGGRGSGKTTLLAHLFPEGVPGLTTWAQPGKGVFLRENFTENTAQVGVYDPSLPGTENRMAPLGDGFAAFGIPALLRCAESDRPWVSVDEIGYLEAGNSGYHEALYGLMEKKHLAAVVRRQELPFLRELCRREDVFLVDLDDPFGKIGCVIMASGVGERFGGNKLVADFGGEPMICRILDAAVSLFPRNVVVTRHPEVAQLAEERGIQTVLHDLPHRSDTVRLGLEQLKSVERCMFCAGDQPLLRRDTLASLALSAANGVDFIWRPVCGQTPGNPVIFPEWAIPELLQLPEGRGGGTVIKKYPERLRTVSVRDVYELKDVDSPKDLEELLGR